LFELGQLLLVQKEKDWKISKLHQRKESHQ
jgi:hypothetical protein